MWNNIIIIINLYWFFFSKLFEENVLALEAWLKENKLMAHKEVFAAEVDDLNDLSCEILEDNEVIMDFIRKDLGVSKILKQRKILNAIKKLQGMYIVQYIYTGFYCFLLCFCS